MSNFSQLGLSSWIVRQLDAIGIKQPSSIQEHCIPSILKGQHCNGAAKTGSGKTLAFVLPILQKLSEDPYGIFALVLTPTRELAFQISDTFAVIGKSINLRQCVIVGGMQMVDQSLNLSKKPHVVIATPGRLCDLFNSSNTISLKRLRYLVLDEADRLLGGSFDEQINTILERVPKSKQVLLFSATMTGVLSKVKEITEGKLFQWEQEAPIATVDELKQYYTLSPVHVKDGYLVGTLLSFSEKSDEIHSSVIIFTDTCKNCQLLSMTLNQIGFRNVALHGMISQKERLTSLNKFKSHLCRILIATDVASRGLDIPEVDLVINHNVPAVPKDYIHRVGRTARAGKLGSAVTLVTPNDLKLLKNIEESINTKLEFYPVESRQVAEVFTQISVVKREAEIKLDQKDFYEKKEINKRKKMILEGKYLSDDEIQFIPLRKNKKRRGN